MRYIILIVCSLLLITSCKKKCSDEVSQKSYLDSELEAYFGVFKKGNYWVYENEDKTKRDSIYVTASNRKFIKDIKTCDGFETLDFTLKEKEMDVVIFGDSMCVNAQSNILNFRKCPSGAFFFSRLLNIYFNSDTIKGDVYINRLKQLIINGDIYSKNLLEIYYENDTIYMQQGVGIIGWKKNNNTYNLVNKYIQP